MKNGKKMPEANERNINIHSSILEAILISTKVVMKETMIGSNERRKVRVDYIQTALIFVKKEMRKCMKRNTMKNKWRKAINSKKTES